MVAFWYHYFEKEEDSAMKRKRVVALLTTILATGCAACGGGKESAVLPGGDGHMAAKAKASERKTEVDQDKEAASDGSGTLGDYHVTISGATLTKDYEGNSALVVTYTWSNHGADTINAAAILAAQAYQNGVELERAIIGDSTVYDSEAEWKEIPPGASLTVQYAFGMDSETTPVKVKISELLCSDGAAVVRTFDPVSL